MRVRPVPHVGEVQPTKEAVGWPSQQRVRVKTWWLFKVSRVLPVPFTVWHAERLVARHGPRYGLPLGLEWTTFGSVHDFIFSLEKQRERSRLRALKRQRKGGSILR